jgi:hypothetical protein
VYILEAGARLRYFAVEYPVSNSRPVLPITPFGSPVVPDVYKRLRTDSGVRFSRRDSGMGVLSERDAMNEGS